MRITWILPLLILVLLIMPVGAVVVTAEPMGTELESVSARGVTTYVYDASPEGRAIQRVSIDAPIGSKVDFILTYGNQQTMTGSYEYKNDIVDPITGTGFVTSDISLAGETSTYTYFSNNHVGRIYITGYAKNETSPGTWQSGFLVYGGTLGISTITNDFVFTPITGDPVMYKISLASTEPLTSITVFTNTREAVAGAVSKSFLDIINEWVEFATQMGGTVLQVASDSLYWLRFIFIENLGMVVTLYIAATMAFAARSCNGNPIKMGKTFIHDQRELFHFILGLWHTLVDLIASFRGIFRI